MTKSHYWTCYANAIRSEFYGLAKAIAVLYFAEWGEAMPALPPGAK